MPSSRSFLLPACLLVALACDNTQQATADDPNKCGTSKDCVDGRTCFGSRCLSADELRAREEELASKTGQPSGAGSTEKVPSNGAAAAGAAAPASGGRVPAFNTTTYCESVSQAAGGSFVIKRQCESDEKQARTSIAAAPTPDRIYSHCEGVALAVGGSYTIMRQCIRDEVEASAKPANAGAELGSGELPDFDIAGYCETVSQAAGGSFQIKRACESQEREARLALSRQNLPKRVYRTCKQTANAVGGSYEIMKACVEQELAAMAGG